MDKQSRIAYIYAQIALLQVELAKMQAANSQYPEDQPYGEKAFQDLLDNYSCLSHNSVIEYLRD